MNPQQTLKKYFRTAYKKRESLIINDKCFSFSEVSRMIQALDSTHFASISFAIHKNMRINGSERRLNKMRKLSKETRYYRLNKACDSLLSILA